MISTQRRRNGRALSQALTLALAVMLAIFVTLVTANVALAWMVDSDELSESLSIKDIEEEPQPQEPRLYAAVYEAREGVGYDLIIAEGLSPSDDGREPLEVFYGFLDAGMHGNQPWEAYAFDIQCVDIRCDIRPTSTADWFNGCERLHQFTGLEHIDATMLADTSRMFKDCTSLEEIDITSWNTESLLSCDEMFADCRALKRSDLSHLHLTSGSAIPKDLFTGCSSLVEIHVSAAMTFASGSVPAPYNQDSDGLWFVPGEGDGITPEEVVARVQANFHANDGTNVLSFYGYGRAYVAAYARSAYNPTVLVFGRGIPPDTFDSRKRMAVWRGIEEGTEDFSNPTTAKPPWYSKYAQYIYKVASLTENKIKPLTMYLWFLGCTKLEELDLSSIDTQKVTTMESAFQNCQILPHIDASHWNTGNVVNMKQVFYNCYALESLDVSGWDTSNVTNRRGIFSGCQTLKTLDVSQWDTANVTDMQSTFYDCKSLEELDVSQWNVNKVLYFERMFMLDYVLDVIDMSQWYESMTPDAIPNTWAIPIQAMFSGCRAVKELDLSWLATRSVSTSTGNPLFETLYDLRVIHIPASIQLASSFRNSGEYADQKGAYWYLDGKGDPYTSKELVYYNNAIFSAHRYENVVTHWFRDLLPEVEASALDEAADDEALTMEGSEDVPGAVLEDQRDPMGGSLIAEEKDTEHDDTDSKEIASPGHPAREIMDRSSVSSAPLVTVDCRLVPSSRKGEQIRRCLKLTPVGQTGSSPFREAVLRA